MSADGLLSPEAQALADALTTAMGSVCIYEREYERQPLTRVAFTLEKMRAAGWPVCTRGLEGHIIKVDHGRLDVTTLHDNAGLRYTWLV